MGEIISHKGYFVDIRKYGRSYIATTAASISLQAQVSKPDPTASTLLLLTCASPHHSALRDDLCGIGGWIPAFAGME